MLFYYLYGTLLAFIVNVVHSYVFFQDIKAKNYPTWQKVNVFVWSSIIISTLSWFGFIFVSISLGVRIKEWCK